MRSHFKNSTHLTKTGTVWVPHPWVSKCALTCPGTIFGSVRPPAHILKTIRADELRIPCEFSKNPGLGVILCQYKTFEINAVLMWHTPSFIPPPLKTRGFHSLWKPESRPSFTAKLQWAQVEGHQTSPTKTMGKGFVISYVFFSSCYSLQLCAKVSIKNTPSL